MNFTKYLKLQSPLKKFVGDDEVISYGETHTWG